MFSPKNKKQKGIVFVLALFVFSSGLFLFSPHSAHAWSFWGFAADAASETIGTVFKGLLYGIFLVIGMFTSMAVTLFEWAIKPEYISGSGGLLNRQSVYMMWKFIRDFFNLFFILTLLYTAFTIVFQVAKDYKKTLLSLVLAALIVNFSFPLTRVIIDMTNVPMYFFVNKIGSTGTTQKDYLGTMLSASQIKKILIPGSEAGGTVELGQIDVSRLLMAIIFIFVFTVSILVLSVLMVIRLVALIMLLIFSSVGFAASVIPGMESYGKDWWQYLWNYSLFGPTSMLMLYIATQFFAEIAKDNTSAQFLQSGVANATPASADFVSSMAMFTVPIIMLWMTIFMASKSSIIGADVIAGKGQKFIKWAGRKTYNNSLTRGVGTGTKDRLQAKFPGTTRFLTSKGGAEAAIKGWTKKTGVNPFGKAGRDGARTELQKIKDKQIHEQVAKDKESKLSRTDALKRLDSSDEVMRVAAARSLAGMDNGIQSMDDLTKALDALKKINPVTGKETYTERAVEVIAKADKKVISDTVNPGTGVRTTGLQNLNAVIGSLGTNEKAINDLISKLDDSAFSGTGADYAAVEASVRGVNASLVGALDAKVRKEGQAKVLVDAQVAGGATVAAAVQGVLGSMKSVKDIVNSKSLFQDPRYQVDAVNYVTTQPAIRYQEIKKIAAQESPAVFALI